MNTKCMRFSVRVHPVKSYETVHLTGSLPELGFWNPKRAIELRKSDEDGQFETWSTLVELKGTPVDIEYRYFIGAVLDAGEEHNDTLHETNGTNGHIPQSAYKGPVLAVVKWEQTLRPRRRILHGIPAKILYDTTVDNFGMIDGRCVDADGWLSNANENMVYIRVHGAAISFFDKRKNKLAFRIKVVPYDTRHKSSIDCDDHPPEPAKPSAHPSFTDTEISVLTRHDPIFGAQYEHGSIFRNNTDYLVFRTRTVALNYLLLGFEIYTESGKQFGVGYAPAYIEHTYAKTNVALIDKNMQPLCQLNYDYMIVSATSTPHELLRDNMSVSYGGHWKKRGTLEVGHRGCGNSYTRGALARENTIHSLNSAARKGADFVEFDVQLTKDLCAIIYHDFHVMVEVAHRKGSDEELSQIEKHQTMAVKDLKRNQLERLYLEHCHHSTRPADSLRVVPQQGEDMEIDHQPFPTLVDALKRVDINVGFNIEVKYPMLQKNGEHECEHYFERNKFIDVILNDVIENAGTRRIIFSSFDPDVCTLISKKQHKYPVLFLVVGATTRYVPFEDIRSDSSLLAVNYAAGTGLLGLNFHSEELLKDSDPVERANYFHLVKFVWGDDVNERKNQEYFKNQLKLDGIIYDRIGEELERKSIFVIEKEAKETLFHRSGAPTPSMSRRGSLDRNELKDTPVEPVLNGTKEASPRRSPKRSFSIHPVC